MHKNFGLKATVDVKALIPVHLLFIQFLVCLLIFNYQCVSAKNKSSFCTVKKLPIFCH